MMTRYNHTEAFRYFGVTPKNVQWSWSGLGHNPPRVAVTLWDHELGMIRDRFSFEGQPDMSKLGARELVKNLRWALEHCNGRVHVIRAFAKDPKADKLKIDYCIPASFTMKVVRFDLETGEFLLQIELPEEVAA